ncbi:hypothetical protein CALVIDRAFT_538791 [Calocera viscosa TUFC12733]|uniref:Uncharacterized protein n=1 Tax=Calocera viscosa (strain TUFC12733) TaxID=1330018 RepID=A0A167KI47_CALVF|nr:hypothetical protein CALVIDRAFT_538791 [Calocera viscosa TUFC12733]
MGVGDLPLPLLLALPFLPHLLSSCVPPLPSLCPSLRAGHDHPLLPPRLLRPFLPLPLLLLIPLIFVETPLPTRPRTVCAACGAPSGPRGVYIPNQGVSHEYGERGVGGRGQEGGSRGECALCHMVGIQMDSQRVFIFFYSSRRRPRKAMRLLQKCTLGRLRY